MPGSALRAFTCTLCSKVYRELPFSAICEDCEKPLTAIYEYEEVRNALRDKPLTERPMSIWRFEEMLPCAEEKRVGRLTGFSPLVRVPTLGREIGIDNLWIKNDAALYPTLSYKDRVVSMAIQKALEIGYDRIGCVSTGNVGNSVAAIGARGGIKVAVFYPRQCDQAKVLSTAAYGPEVVRMDGTYDEVNAMAREVSMATGVPFVNVNLRPYYAEGAKTMSYEIAEQLDWQPPDHCVIPVAGTTLIRKVIKGFWELGEVGLTGPMNTRVHAAQAEGCSPVVKAILEGKSEIEPVVPNTFADSIAIGAPSEGGMAATEIAGTGGTAAAIPDEEIKRGMALLARTEGILAEPAGGTSISAAIRMREDGTINQSDRVVVAVTGHGLKTLDAIEQLPASGRDRILTRSGVTTAFDAWLQNVGVSAT